MRVGGAPSYLTRFVGRDDLRRAVADAIESSRLVTLLGAGGIGKTRLAVEVAANASRFDRAVFVDLTAERADEGGVTAAVAGAVGDLRGDDGRSVLAVVDNCEHVIDEAREAVTALLQTSDAVTVLATSREPLGVAGEACVAVPPLDPSSDAPALFVDRARLVVAGFEPDGADDDAIAQLCRRVDGLPLAIELAAARLRVLSPREILDRIDERFRVLADTGGQRPERHRTLEAAIEWSHDLLDEREQRVLRRLAVFPASFDLEAAAAVLMTSPADGGSVVDVVERLVAKSLVQSGRIDGRTQFWLLESIREKALGWLADAGETETARRAHLEWVAGAVSAIDDVYATVPYREFLGRLTALAADADAAFDTAVACEPETALSLTAVLWHLWMNRGAIASGRERAAAALGASPSPSPARARAANAAGNLDVLAGDLGRARRWYEEALRLRRDSGDTTGEVNALNDLGVLELRAGDLSSAEERLRGAAALAEELDNRHAAATAHVNLGALFVAAGDASEAERHLAEAARHYGAIGDDLGLAATHGNLATLHVDRGDVAGAEAALAEAVRSVARIDDRSLVPSLVTIAAAVAAGRGRLAEAASHLGAAAGLRSRRGMTPDPAEAELEASLRSRLEADLGADRFESASADGAERDEATALDAIVAPTVVVSAAAPEEARLTRRGDRWEVAFRGRTSHVPDSRGVRYLSVLLARAQEEVGVLELVSVDAGEPVAADGDLGDVLDPAARAAFRERLVALRADRERAERRGDGAALELIDGEVAAIGAALGAATGLGGRARRAGGDAERARKAVTNRIRHAMGVFETADPDVGAHLRNSVRTGAFCVYRPERPLTWTIDG